MNIKHRVLVKRIVILLTLTVLVGMFPQGNMNINAQESMNAPSFPHVKRVSNTALQVSWNKVKGASGYEVFRYDSSKKKYVKAKTISKPSIVKWKDAKLKTGKKYSYKVRAWQKVRNVSGKNVKQYSAFTYAVSAAPYKRRSNIVNAGTTFKGSTTMTIGLMQKLKLPVSVTPSKYGKSKKKTVIDKNVRVLLTNKTFIGQADSKTIIGKAVGKTNVYALAHNGNVEKITVNVVDYAKPTDWYWNNLNEMNKDELALFTNHSKELTDVVSWLAQHSSKEGRLLLDDDGNLINEEGIVLGEMESQIKSFLSCIEPTGLDITVSKRGIRVGTWSYGRYDIIYNIQDDYNEPKNAGVYDGLKIAPHWHYSLFLAV